VGPIVVAENPTEIESLRERWEKLPAPTMFQSFAWNYAAACVFRDREKPHVVYAETDSGAALIPAAVRDGKLRMLGDAMFDYRDVLLQGDAGVLEAAWARVAELGFDFETGALRQDGNIAAWDGFELSRYYGAPFVSHADAADFASKHHRLARWVRRFAREGVHLRSHTGENSALVRQIYERKADQPAESGGSLFADALRVEFMLRVCAAVGTACEIFTYETAGTLVASLVTFRDGNVRRFYTVQFDTAWAKYSPGTVLIYEITRRSLEAGLDCDYMTGEHAYKMRFATSVVPMYWVQADRQTLASMPQMRPMAA
jgi:CelD/BcsL family acetyltransferase involved in cellulose biosynthesis